MCDYSLHGLRNRLGAEGEELVVHRFSTGAMGLTSGEELCRMLRPRSESPKKGFWSALQALILPPVVPEALAVCIPPGARLRLSDIPSSLQRELDIGPEELVVFNQTSLMPNTYHDGVRFANGRQILLQALKEGQRVLVISLASDKSSRHELEKGGITQEAVSTLSSVHERQM
jgi:hypothetical protein